MLSDAEIPYIVGAYCCGDKNFNHPCTEKLVVENIWRLHECIDRYYADRDDPDAYEYHLRVFKRETELLWNNLDAIDDAALDVRTNSNKTSLAEDIAKLQSLVLNLTVKPMTGVKASAYTARPYKSYKCYNDLHACFDYEGFRTGSLYIIGGYTGSGKSCFALNILEQLKEPLNVVYYNMENSESDTKERLDKFSYRPPVNDFTIIDGIHTPDAIYSDIVKNKYDFIVIDQLSMFDITSTADDLRLQYKAICQKLAEIARDTNSVIILNCQLNRQYMARFLNCSGSADKEAAWRQAFRDLDDTAIAESADITRPAQAAVIVTRHDSMTPMTSAYWAVNVKSRSGKYIKCKYYDIYNSIVITNNKDY